jgi:hypothetical protein
LSGDGEYISAHSARETTAQDEDGLKKKEQSDDKEPGPSWGKQLPGERPRETAET